MQPNVQIEQNPKSRQKARNDGKIRKNSWSKLNKKNSLCVAKNLAVTSAKALSSVLWRHSCSPSCAAFLLCSAFVIFSPYFGRLPLVKFPFVFAENFAMPLVSSLQIF